MSQPWYVTHAETIAQNVVGQVIAFVIFWLYGLEMHDGLQLQLIFFVAAYVRGYTIRRFFNWLSQRKGY